MRDMKTCPHCGSASGYFVKVRISGLGVYYYNADGTDADENGQIHDDLGYKEQKTKYCSKCQRKLPKGW